MVKKHLHLNKQNKNMLMRNLVSQLFTHQQITTTLPKAKEAKKVADRLITKGKKGTIESISLANSFLIVSYSFEERRPLLILFYSLLPLKILWKLSKMI